MSANKYVVVGEVAKPHGVKGELCIISHAKSPSLFDGVPRVLLEPKSAGQTGTEAAGATRGRGLSRPRGVRPTKSRPNWRKVLSWRPHQDRVLLTLEGIDDRDAAEALRGMLVSIDAAYLPPRSEEEVFIHEILGLRVREAGAASDASGGAPDLGVLEDVLDEAGQELWVIRDPSGREILLPAVPEFVEDIDIDGGLIVICPPPGLLELYAAPAEEDRDDPERERADEPSPDR